MDGSRIGLLSNDFFTRVFFIIDLAFYLVGTMVYISFLGGKGCISLFFYISFVLTWIVAMYLLTQPAGSSMSHSDKKSLTIIN